jgi:hypothetical protein
MLAPCKFLRNENKVAPCLINLGHLLALFRDLADCNDAFYEYNSRYISRKKKRTTLMRATWRFQSRSTHPPDALYEAA